mgnify:CR=1 FL=1
MVTVGENNIFKMVCNFLFCMQLPESLVVIVLEIICLAIVTL